MNSIAHMEGIKIGGININNLRYADDTAIIAETEDQLQKIMDIVTTESNKAGLEINQKKSFTQVISKKRQIPKCSIKVDGAIIKQVDSFIYLGSLITSNGKSDKEIVRRIGIAKTAFKSMTSILTSKGISMQAKLRTLKCYVWSTLLYGCETWTISKALEKRLVAIETWFLRRILRVS